ncbi:MAG TPA: hypothetical protein DET40_12695 [Lentisphaeria bacterium]|nr:MAG: hypothetical protein A2X45_20605 [Lentisphaerae bacterium GWF2_50_93]HCE44398.1 hypothetical protein [Lentisphaeria bacterium]
MKNQRRNSCGWVDLQVNGVKGINFSDIGLTPDEFSSACEVILKGGTDVFLPTIITSPVKVYEHNLKMMVKFIDEEKLRDRIPGFHLEGPFISPEPGYVGAHNPAYTQKPSPELLRKFHEWSGGKIKILTIAAELEGADKLVKAAVKLGITVSIGHSNFNSEHLKEMASLGAKAITHLANGLPLNLAKFANPIWAGLCEEKLIGMFVGDGHHIPGDILKKMIMAKGIGKTIIVSDASPLAGCKPGTYDVFGTNAVLDKSGRLYNPVKLNLMGSSYTMPKCMDYLKKLDFLSKKELHKVGYQNPLDLIS